MRRVRYKASMEPFFRRTRETNPQREKDRAELLQSRSGAGSALRAREDLDQLRRWRRNLVGTISEASLTELAATE
jgi:hypothetical protein